MSRQYRTPGLGKLIRIDRPVDQWQGILLTHEDRKEDMGRTRHTK